MAPACHNVFRSATLLAGLLQDRVHHALTQAEPFSAKTFQFRAKCRQPSQLLRPQEQSNRANSVEPHLRHLAASFLLIHQHPVNVEFPGQYDGLRLT